MSEINSNIVFDIIVARNLLRTSSAEDLLLSTAKRLVNNGQIVLLESLPERATKLYEALEMDSINDTYHAAIKDAEETFFGIHRSSAEEKLQSFVAPLIKELHTELIFRSRKIEITPSLIARWFTTSRYHSYAQILRNGNVPNIAVTKMLENLEKKIGNFL